MTTRAFLNFLLCACSLALTACLSVQARAAAPPNPCGADFPPPPNTRYTDDMRTKNIDDILNLYTSDAVFIDPTGNRTVGLEALRTLYQHVFAIYDSDLTFSPTQFTRSALHGVHICTESGTYVENLRVRSTGAMLRPCGAYRFTYRLDHNHQWLLCRQEWTGPPLDQNPSHQ